MDIAIPRFLLDEGYSLFLEPLREDGFQDVEWVVK
jgi:hypothetical protein